MHFHILEQTIFQKMNLSCMWFLPLLPYSLDLCHLYAAELFFSASQIISLVKRKETSVDNLFWLMQLECHEHS